jgi:hypothetical protein
MSNTKRDGIESNGRLKRKEYERELARLHALARAARSRR